MGCLAIDTNVFLDILNPEKNTNSHINKLLEHLQKCSVMLIVDEEREIEKEYSCRIRQIVEGISVTQEKTNERYMLRYWLYKSERHRVPVTSEDELMRGIKKIIYEDDENVDRIFVYVAFMAEKILITNDKKDILFGTKQESANYETHRRTRLLNMANQHQFSGVGILTSQEAHGRLSA